MPNVALTTSTIPSTVLDPNAHNHLPLPGGETIGSVSTEDLRRRLAKLGVEKAWTRPKNEIVKRLLGNLEARLRRRRQRRRRNMD